MKRATLLLAAAIAAPALHAQSAAGTPAAVQASAPQVRAEVRRVDREAGKVTLRHEAIPNLDMPPMTMVFEAVQPAQLDGLKAGDKVLFMADRQDGRYLATDVRPAAK